MGSTREFSERRRALNTAVGATLGTGLAGFTPGLRAQANAGKMIVGFAAGGSVDSLTRIMADFFTQKAGKPYVAENRTGAAGRLAVEAVKSAKADGDTFLVCPSGPLTLFPYVFKNLKYDPFKDLTVIARLSSFEVGIGLGPASGTDSLSKFLAWAKANPSKASYGSSGSGTLLHFAGAGLAQKTGVSMAHVGYRGAAPAVIDLIGGQVPMVVAPLSDMLEQHKAGRIKVVAVMSDKRSPLAPEVPTAKQEGVDVDVPGWYALCGPGGMPKDLVNRYSGWAAEAVGQASVKERMLKMGMVSDYLGPEPVAALQRRETAWWEAAVKASGFTPED